MSTFIWPLFFQEKSNRPVCSSSARFSFIFMQLQLHSHAGAPQCEHAILLSTTAQLRGTNGPKSKEWGHRSTSAARWRSSSGLINMAAARSLCLVFHYAIKYCVISGVLILFKSLQLPCWCLWWCIHSHFSYWNVCRNLEYRLMKCYTPLMFQHQSAPPFYRQTIPFLSVWSFISLQQPHTTYLVLFLARFFC